MKTEIARKVVAHAILARPVAATVNYGMLFGSNLSQSNDSHSVHLRNGGEPWKGSGKRKMR